MGEGGEKETEAERQIEATSKQREGRGEQSHLRRRIRQTVYRKIRSLCSYSSFPPIESSFAW
jgi:hypothetical protein